MSKNRSRTSARPLEMEVKPWNEDTKGKELLDRECRRTWCVWRVKTLAGGTGRALGAWAGASVSQAGSPSLGSPSPPPAPLRVGIGRRSNRHASDKAEQWRPRGRREKKSGCKGSGWWVRTMRSLWRRVIAGDMSQRETSIYASLRKASASILHVAMGV